MAEKRMFTQKIIDSDAFLDMPLSAQALYFHLCMRADDDGFVNNPKKITRYVSASEDDLKLLMAKRFLIGFESGVIVIKHWRMHNTLKSDRYNPTDYQEEYARLTIKANKAYTERAEVPALPEPEWSQMDDSPEPEWNQSGTKPEPTRNQDGSKPEPQIREDKRRKEKISIEGSACAPRTATQIAEETMEHWRIDLAAAVRDWLAYKKEKRQGYKEVGLRTLLSQIRQAADKYGEDAVIEIIHNSMASGYQGITLDRLQEKKRSPAYASSGKAQGLSSAEWDEVMARI